MTTSLSAGISQRGCLPYSIEHLQSTSKHLPLSSPLTCATIIASIFACEIRRITWNEYILIKFSVFRFPFSVSRFNELRKLSKTAREHYLPLPVENRAIYLFLLEQLWRFWQKFSAHTRKGNQVWACSRQLSTRDSSGSFPKTGSINKINFTCVRTPRTSGTGNCVCVWMPQLLLWLCLF